MPASETSAKPQPSSTPRAVAVGEEPGDDHHDRDQDAELDERERRPRRLGRLVHPRAAVRRRGAGAARAAPGSRRARGGASCAVIERLRLRRPMGGRMLRVPRAANGQPEESLTCHQPIEHPDEPEPRPDLVDAAAALAELARAARRAQR